MNMAVIVASNLGQIWEIKHGENLTTIIVTAKDNVDYKVSWYHNSTNVIIEQW